MIIFKRQVSDLYPFFEPAALHQEHSMNHRKIFGILFMVLALSCLMVAPANAAGALSKYSATAEHILKMASPSNPQDNCVKAFYKFQELLEAKTDGKIAVEVYHSGQLGAHRDYIEGLQMGSLQGAEVNVAVLSAFDNEFMVFDLPYISRDVTHLKSVLDGGVADKLAKNLEDKTGIKIVGWMLRSPRNLYNSKRPVVTADDFSGMKVRIMESPIMTRTFELLGAVPVPLSASERYMALQTGVVDAAENSIPLIITQKEYEVTKYLSKTGHFLSPNIIAISGRFFKGLTPEQQQAVLEAGREAGAYATKLDAESEDAAIAELEKLGMKANDCPDKSSFIKKVSPIYEEYKKEIGEDLINAFLSK